MPPWFLLAEFPLHLESLARDCGVDPGTLLELAPEWSGSLAELLDAAQELGPDVP
jgi:hypothetical protein